MKKQLKWQEKLLGVQRGLISGAAGKPHSIVYIEAPKPIPVPIEIDSRAFEEADPNEEMAVPEKYRVRKFNVAAGLRLWAATIADYAKRAGVEIEDLWVLFSCRGHGDTVQVVTRIRNDMIGFRMNEQMTGSLHVYARLPDLLSAVIDQDVPQFAVLPDTISFVTKGVRQEFPVVTQLRTNIAKPATPPSTGYAEIRNLGTALCEAMKWTADGPDYAGRGDIRVIPRTDGSGMADVFGLKPEAGYRRTVKAPGLKHSLVIPTLWLFEHTNLIGAHLGVRVTGRDYMWLTSANGMVLGIEMKPEEPWCDGYQPYFEGLDGRVEFTVDQVDAFRRALLQVTPMRFADNEPGLGITPNGHGITIRGLDKTLEVDGMGDAGPEVYLDPDMLGQALAATNVRFLEFDKEDDEQYVRLSGPDVRITVAPLGSRDEKVAPAPAMKE